ncbi:MAG: hypothetical protein LBG26_04610, partial [Treponema sp.]|nr:hypothetical protein [Treponema sp.]
PGSFEIGGIKQAGAGSHNQGGQNDKAKPRKPHPQRHDGKGNQRIPEQIQKEKHNNSIDNIAGTDNEKKITLFIQNTPPKQTSGFSPDGKL